ncbi:MAG: NADP-dependent oxidoreductase [Chloroflexi bacterium]|nr:NADP-dependent oxidoreductase [Chloroflexota bacterium]
MKAVRVNEWAKPVNVEEIPQPSPANDEVLVRVHAAGVDPMEAGVAAGYLQSMLSVPLTLGRNFAGEVVAVGEDVKHVKPGDAVYGMSPIQATFAEYAAVKAHGVAHKPKSLDDVQAAAVPVVGLSAWQALVDLAKLQKGERILIHGAGGGIGTFAVQLAKDIGAYVIGNEKADNIAFVRQLGADEVIDAESQRFEDVVDKVDVVLDLVRGEYVERSYNILKPRGRYVTTANMLPEGAGKEQGIVAMGHFTQPTVEELTKLAEAIDAGKLKVFVSRTFPIEEAQTALYYQPEAGSPGKVVIQIQ